MKFLWIACTLLILGFLFWPAYRDSGARTAAAQAQIAALQAGLQSYHDDTGEFPTEGQGLRALRINPGLYRWKGPYLITDIPRDPWGEPYQYRVAGGGSQVFSLEGGSLKGERAITVEGVRQPSRSTARGRCAS